MTAQHPHWLTIDRPGFSQGNWQVHGVIRHILHNNNKWTVAYRADPGSPPSLSSANWSGFTELYRLTPTGHLRLEWFEYDSPDWEPVYVNELIEGDFYLYLCSSFFGPGRLYISFRDGVIDERDAWFHEAPGAKEITQGCHPMFPIFYQSPPPDPQQARALNVTPEALCALVDFYPEEVQQNPALPLLSLESPGMYQKITQSIRLDSLDKELERKLIQLGERERRLFTIDCAERVLPLYERNHPTDPRPRQGLEVAKRFAQGDASLRELVAQHRIITEIEDNTDAEEDGTSTRAICAALDLSPYRGARTVERMSFSGETIEAKIADYEWQLAILEGFGGTSL